MQWPIYNILGIHRCNCNSDCKYHSNLTTMETYKSDLETVGLADSGAESIHRQRFQARITRCVGLHTIVLQIKW